MELSRRLRWSAGTTLGLALVGFGLHFPGSGGDAWQPGAIVFGGFLGVVSGLIVGFVQWALLRPVVAGLGPLITAMAIGIGVSHALGDGAPVSLGRAPVAIAGALALTVAFAIVLVERRPLALGASFVGWAGGWLLGYALTGALGLPASEDPIGWASEHAAVAIVVGVAWGGLIAAVGMPASLAPTAITPAGRHTSP